MSKGYYTVCIKFPKKRNTLILFLLLINFKKTVFSKKLWPILFRHTFCYKNTKIHLALEKHKKKKKKNRFNNEQTIMK